jgi:predicted transposase/invertase (TIGR01784 family)
MTEPLSNPHDRFFKETFSQQENARSFLQHYLPSEITPLLDFSTLEISKDSFIDPILEEHLSDLLYKVTLYEGPEIHIYVLFEHKSYPDRLIAFQLLRYMVRIWEQALKQKQKLLPILPLVIYHGRSRWTIPTDFTALMELPEALKPYVPAYQYWIFDLTQYDDEEIQGEITLRVTLLLLKYIFRKDLGDRIGEILDFLRALSEPQTVLEYLETILRYIAASTDQVNEEMLKQIVNQVIAEGGELMPTLVEQWLERGRQEGLEAGLERGRETALDLLRWFLVHRFGTVPERFDEESSKLDLEAISQLSKTAFETESLANFEMAMVKLVKSQERTNKPEGGSFQAGSAASVSDKE